MSVVAHLEAASARPAARACRADRSGARRRRDRHLRRPGAARIEEWQCGRRAGARSSSDADPPVARGHRRRLRRALRRQPRARRPPLRNDPAGEPIVFAGAVVDPPPRGVRRRRLSDGPAEDRGGVLEARGRRRRRASGSSRPRPISPTATAGAEPMAGIDDSLPFHPLRIAVLTVSDTRDEETDRSGALLAERLTKRGS